MTLIVKTSRHVNNYTVTPNRKIVCTVDNTYLFSITSKTIIEKVDDYTLRLRENRKYKRYFYFYSVGCSFVIERDSTLTIDEPTILDSSAMICLEHNVNVTIYNSLFFNTDKDEIKFCRSSNIINSIIFNRGSSVIVPSVNLENQYVFFNNGNVTGYISYQKPSCDIAENDTLIVMANDIYTTVIKFNKNSDRIILKNLQSPNQTICVYNVKKFCQIDNYVMFVGDDNMSISRVKHNNIKPHQYPQDELQRLREQYKVLDIKHSDVIDVNHNDEVLLKFKWIVDNTPNREIEHGIDYKIDRKDFDKIFKNEPVPLINVEKGAKLFIKDSSIVETPYYVNVKENQVVALYEYYGSSCDRPNRYDYIPNLLMKAVLDIESQEHESLPFDVRIRSH